MSILESSHEYQYWERVPDIYKRGVQNGNFRTTEKRTSVTKVEGIVLSGRSQFLR